MVDIGHGDEPDHGLAGAGPHPLVGHAHRDGDEPIAEPEVVAAPMHSDEQTRGSRGRRLDRGSPFYVGLLASAGVAITYGGVRVLGSMSSVLVLIGVAFFFALGLEPVASWLVRRRLPRWAAVTVVVVLTFTVLGGCIAAAIPPLAEQAHQLSEQAPHYLQQVQDRSSVIGRLNDRFLLHQRITDAMNSSGGPALAGVLKAGTAVIGAVVDTGIVAVLSVYFLADLPRLRATLYRFAPRSRRPRVVLLGDEVFAKVGAYVLGNVMTSVIAGVATFVWCIAFNVPYPLLLGVFVAIVDLVPYGSTVAGFVVAGVAVTVSLAVSAATVAFYLVFRGFEDYLLVPKVIGRAVKVPAVVTVVAVLIGAALLGIVGALVAIPVAAALQLLVQQLLFPALDEA